MEDSSKFVQRDCHAAPGAFAHVASQCPNQRFNCGPSDIGFGGARENGVQGRLLLSVHGKESGRFATFHVRMISRIAIN